MSLSLTVREFFATWLPTALVTSAVPPPAPELGQVFFVFIGGVPIPIVTCLLGALGIALSRPFARRKEAELGWPLFLLVSAIMLIVVQLWIIESRPSWLFAFVVSIGMGFSGYSLIELFGENVKTFITDIFTKAQATIGRRPGDDET